MRRMGAMTKELLPFFGTHACVGLVTTQGRLFEPDRRSQRRKQYGQYPILLFCCTYFCFAPAENGRVQNEEKVLPLFFSVPLRNNGVDNLCKSSVSAQTVHCIDWGQSREQKERTPTE